MTRPTIIDDLEVVVRGDLPADVADYARQRISQLGEHLAEPVFHTRIRLTHQPDPGVERPVLAQANVTLKGRMVRAQVAGLTGPEAVDRLRERLQQRLARHARHWQARRGGGPSAEPDQWRHGQEPAHRPSYYPRPVEERQVIRHKSFTPRRISPDEAAREMDQFDYDFHLFTDEQTARDAVVYRGGITGYRLARATAGPEPATSDPPITMSPHPAPHLSFDEARQRLELSGLPFIFFVDPGTGRGMVVYHRYDGHYGVITPTE
jgi:hypothetical protein